MAKDLYVFGAGGAGKELTFSLSLESEEDKKWNIKGFIDDNKNLWGKTINDLPVLGGSEFLKNKRATVAVSTVANPAIKRQIVSRLKSFKSINFPLIISSKSTVASSVKWGEGCIVSLPYNFISVDILVGDFVFINCSTRIGHDAIIGDFTTIYSDIDISGGAKIGSDCVIGSGVTINPGVRIGNRCIIGAGSVVVKDIPDQVIAAGAPARIIKEIK